MPVKGLQLVFPAIEKEFAAHRYRICTLNIMRMQYAYVLLSSGGKRRGRLQRADLVEIDPRPGVLVAVPLTYNILGRAPISAHPGE